MNWTRNRVLGGIGILVTCFGVSWIQGVCWGWLPLQPLGWWISIVGCGMMASALFSDIDGEYKGKKKKVILYNDREVILPVYVRLGKKGTAMELRQLKWEGTYEYYRAGGNWSVDFRVDKKGKVFSVRPDMKHIHNIEFFEITEKEWAKDNGEYAYR